MSAPDGVGGEWHADDIAERSPAVYAVVVDGEAVLLDEASDRLHHLNAPAALVWACLDGHTTVAALARELSDELAEPYDAVLVGTLDIVSDLDAQQLLVPRPPKDAPGTRVDGTSEPAVSEPLEPRWRRRPDALWRRGLDAVLVLPVDADEPVMLTGTGPAVWELLAEPCTVPQLAAVLSEVYDAEPATVEADVRPVVDELVRLGALESP
ncbi:MAG: PqqD family protein [Acidimicrobiia bacterium]